MEILELKAEKRTTKGSKAARKLRESGQIPAILYGHKEDNVMLWHLITRRNRLLSRTYSTTTFPTGLITWISQGLIWTKGFIYGYR